jgi:GDP-mannose 6-dehydrogenase
VTSRTAEMVKYACNAFHAAKISFANEIGALCENLSIPAREVVKILCSDTTLNISPAYMQPGFAFGGSCLTKDLRALRYRASECGLKLPLLESLTESNHAQIERALRKAEEFHGRIGVIGLAFKENTDDVRESAAVIVVEALIRKRRVLRVWDPHISMTSIYGRNREYILTRIPLIETLLVPTLADLIAWNPDCLIVTQKLSKSIRGSLLSSGKLVLDLARLDLET